MAPVISNSISQTHHGVAKKQEAAVADELWSHSMRQLNKVPAEQALLRVSAWGRRRWEQEQGLQIY